MKKRNKFTCISLDHNKLVAGDKLGNVISWRFDPHDNEMTHELIGCLNEKVLDIESSGLTTVCRSKSDRFYLWDVKPSIFGPEIFDGDCINKIPCPKLADEEHGNYKYKLYLKNKSPCLIKYNGYDFKIIDIENSHVIDDVKIPDLATSVFLFDGDYFITPVGVWGRESERCILKMQTYGEEIEDHHDEDAEGYFVTAIPFFVLPIQGGNRKENVYAFIDYMSSGKRLPLDPEGNILDWECEDDMNYENDISSYYCVRIASLDIEKAKFEYDNFGWEDSYDFEVKFDFKIKRNEAKKFSFFDNFMATITEAGSIKIFDIENKCLLHEIFPFKKQKTNEFGDVY